MTTAVRIHVVNRAESWLCYDGNGRRYGCYYMEDETQGEATPVYDELGAQPALFAGNSAEWVVERPQIDGGLPPLAQFGAVSFSLEDVYDSYLGAGDQLVRWLSEHALDV